MASQHKHTGRPHLPTLPPRTTPGAAAQSGSGGAGVAPSTAAA